MRKGKYDRSLVDRTVGFCSSRGFYNQKAGKIMLVSLYAGLKYLEAVEFRGPCRTYRGMPLEFSSSDSGGRTGCVKCLDKAPSRCAR